MQSTGTDNRVPALLKIQSRPHMSRAPKCSRHIERKPTNRTGERKTDDETDTPSNTRNCTVGENNKSGHLSETRRKTWCFENRCVSPVLGNKLTGNKFKKVGKLIVQTRRRPTGYGYSNVPRINLEEFEQEYDFDADDEPTPEEEERLRQIKVLEDSYCKMCKILGSVPCGKFRRQIGSSTADMSNCLLDEKEIKAICVSLTNNVDITDLDLSSNDLSGKGCSYVSEALRENLNIQELTLSECKITLAGLNCIADVLLEMKPMKYLDLSGNKFGANHAIVIAEVIKKNDYIEELVLSNNGFDEESGKLLGKAIQHNVGLKRLDLSWNHIRREGATAVCSALRFNQSIEDLDLSWNGLGEEGTQALGYALPFNHTLRLLDISCNRINIHSLKYFLKGLDANDSLSVLRIDQNPLTTDGAILLMKTIQNSNTSQIADVHMVDIPINGDFLEALDELNKVRTVRVYHRDPNKKKISPIVRKRTLRDFDPAMILFEYMKQENLRLIDLFRTFDTDSSQSVSKEELKAGFNTINMPLNDDALDSLFNKLDTNDNHGIEYDEYKIGYRKAMKKMRNVPKEDDQLAIHQLKDLVKQALVDRRAKKLQMYRRQRTQRQASLTAVFENARGESITQVLETHPSRWV